jgi:DNA repair protein RadC
MKKIPVWKCEIVKESSVAGDWDSVNEPGKGAEIVAKYLGNTDREHLVVLLLNTKNKPIGLNTVSIGSLNSSMGHPREVFKPAILASANALILAHNHPSGDPAPSQEDKQLTARMIQAGDLLGIPVLDHIIIGDGCYYSLKEHGDFPA